MEAKHLTQEAALRFFIDNRKDGVTHAHAISVLRYATAGDAGAAAILDKIEAEAKDGTQRVKRAWTGLLQDVMVTHHGEGTLQITGPRGQEKPLHDFVDAKRAKAVQRALEATTTSQGLAEAWERLVGVTAKAAD